MLMGLVRQAAAALPARDWDIEVFEAHHRRKIDAPSGTALMIADAAASALDFETQYVYDRHSYRKKRDKAEIGIHAVRGGTIVGEHEVLFAGYNETLTISHAAMSRDILASGAIKAAGFLTSCKEPGLYSMDDLVSSL